MAINCLHNQAPQYLVDLCQSISGVAFRQHLRSASRGLLVAPRHRLSSYGRRAFSVAGPVIWNWLSDSLIDPAISRDSFKHSLKTFLFSAYTRVHSVLELFWTMRSTNLLTYLLTYLLTLINQSIDKFI